MNPTDCEARAPSRQLARLYDQHLRALAGHYDNMYDGRANSARYVADYYHHLVSLNPPALFVEVGAYKAEASRRVKRDHPACRVVAFEANPFNFERYAREADVGPGGVEYLNLAVSDTDGPVTFNLRVRQDGADLRKVTGNSSLLRRAGTDTEYQELTVGAVTLDGYFASADGPVALWVDAEGASGQVLRGATGLLQQTELILIEVEEKFIWEEQWRSIDVAEFLLDAGFVPITRDAEYEQQFNIIFVRNDVYERPEVLASLELHTNYLTQHMGAK